MFSPYDKVTYCVSKCYLPNQSRYFAHFISLLLGKTSIHYTVRLERIVSTDAQSVMSLPCSAKETVQRSISDVLLLNLGITIAHNKKGKCKIKTKYYY